MKAVEIGSTLSRLQLASVVEPRGGDRDVASDGRALEAFGEAILFAIRTSLANRCIHCPYVLRRHGIEGLAARKEVGKLVVPTRSRAG